MLFNEKQTNLSGNNTIWAEREVGTKRSNRPGSSNAIRSSPKPNFRYSEDKPQNVQRNNRYSTPPRPKSNVSPINYIENKMADSSKEGPMNDTKKITNSEISLGKIDKKHSRAQSNVENKLKTEDKKDPERFIQTEGVNFQACWEMDEIDSSRISSNDIHGIAEVYGIEAARNSIVKEVNGVFNHYAIKVDFRHLYLVADYMTFHGFVNPMSRAGLTHNTSPFLKMSFETTMKFLTEACLFTDTDNMTTPSSQLVLGRVCKTGTGICDV